MLQSEYQNSVAKLGEYQVAKLEANKHKGRWEDLQPLDAFKLLLKEGAELLEAVINGYSTEEVWKEAADVSNFAMMLAENYQKSKSIGDPNV